MYAFTRLPMGYSNAAYIAQTASELAYGQETMEKFLEHKGWSAGDANWPFLKISDIIIAYELNKYVNIDN